MPQGTSSGTKPPLAAVLDEAREAEAQGDLPAALVGYTSALLRSRRVGDLRSAVVALNGMGAAHVELGELDAAATCLDQAYELAGTVQDASMLADVQVSRAELFLRRQQFEQARQCCDDSFSIFTELDTRRGLASVHRFYGELYRETGKPHLAEIHLGMAGRLAAQLGDVPLHAALEHELARQHDEAGRSLDAVACLNRAYRLLHDRTAAPRSGGAPDTGTARALMELERTYLRVIEQWSAGTIETKDPYTHGHSKRVADYTCALAKAVGIEAGTVAWMRIGALLHDIGKTIVPTSVLGKPGLLNESEWTMMRQHTMAGADIVASLDLPFDVQPMIRHHHERWDGNGYPDGLAGDAIPLTARILTIADVYEALTSRRSYRNAFSPREARRIMRHQAGRALDPILVERFEAMPPLE